MRTFHHILIFFLASLLSISCENRSESSMDNRNKTAEEILGNNEYQAISYGGYRENTRDIQPTIEELKEDMRILHAMGIKLIRTYNVHCLTLRTC